VITLPLGVLQATPESLTGVRFQPDVTVHRAAWPRLKMGPVVKVILRFREVFSEQGSDGLAFLHTPAGPFHVWWTTRPLCTLVLTGWAGGQGSRAGRARSAGGAGHRHGRAGCRLLRGPLAH
jgi:Flavin containing amine oxidoreductase